MRIYVALMIAVELLIVGCSVPSAPSPPEINGPIRAVQFPDPWMRETNGAWVGVNDAVHYVVRKPADASRAELFFAVKTGFDGTLFGKEVSEFPVSSGGYDYYSDNRFSVNLEAPLRIREITDVEWYSAANALQSYYFIHKDDSRVTAEGVKYHERLYRKTGESWGGEVALVSPRQTRIAIFSYTSREKVSESFLPGLKNTEPGSGEVFLDIYDLSTGEKAGSVHSPFGQKPNGFAPSMLFGASVWIEDRYIVMPLDPELSRCLIGVFPDKQN